MKFRNKHDMILLLYAGMSFLFDFNIHFIILLFFPFWFFYSMIQNQKPQKNREYYFGTVYVCMYDPSTELGPSSLSSSSYRLFGNTL